MASTYPHYPYFWAAYGITALIYVAYGVTLYRRYLRTKLQHFLVRSVHERNPPR